MTHSALDEVSLQIARGCAAGVADAIRIARYTNTKLVIYQNGQIVELTADEYEALYRTSESQLD